MKSPDGNTQELLIIRRGGGDDGMTVKGGAWKIAYADFVTAMMAFFLVMWLINSANEVTKARVASYFNPIKMTDAAPTRRGLKETTDAQSPNVHVEQDGGANKRGASKSAESASEAASSAIPDEALLMSPFTMLDELLKRAESSKIIGAAPVEIVEVGDPFNPHAFENLKEVSTANATVVDGDRTPHGTKSGTSDTTEKQSSVDAVDQRHMSEAEVRDAKEGERTAPKEIDQVRVSPNQDAVVPTDKQDAKTPHLPLQPNGPSAADEKLAEDLRERIDARLEGTRDKLDISVRVEATEEGLLIVLEDGKGRSMFAVGSAQPNPVLIEIVGEIGEALAKTERGVVIRGHTDGRQFRNRKYDNWQLSTDRAHMASYMLMRGGLPESQVSRIEGYGSSKPIEKGNDMLDANRRVEFLLAK